MNVIFLDVDGVLNSQQTDERCNGVIGIDSDKVAKLAEIVQSNDAILLLTSSWRLHWWKPEKVGDEQHPLGEYLDKKLAEYNLKIYDIVPYAGFGRGKAILKWLDTTDLEVNKFIILDDEMFDYGDDDVRLRGYVVKTSFYGEQGGLQDLHIKEANRKFKKQVDRS